MKKFIFLVLLVMLLFILPKSIFAQESTIAQPSGSFTVSSEAPLYDAIDKKELGILSAGSTGDYAKTEDGKVYIQWGDHLAYLSVDQVNFDDSQKTSPKLNESNPIGHIQVLKDTYMHSLDGEKFVAVKAGVEYPYESIDTEGNYQVIIANQLSYFSKDDVKIVQKDSSGEKVAGDKSQVDTDKQSQSTSGQMNPSVKSSVKDVKVIGPQTNTATPEAIFGDYFEVIDNIPVYNNQRGDKLVQVGTLQKGQTYQRVSDYGNWHRIRFGNEYGYVSKAATLPSNSNKIKNLNTKYQNGSINVEALTKVTVYDNTSSTKLVPFATILKNEKFPLANEYEYGNWYRVLISGRVGYIRKTEVQKLDFADQDKFFRVVENNVPIYNNERGQSLVQVGTLEKGQAYERVSDYGNWHRIQFEGGYGYVKKSQTLPDDGKSIDNLNTSYKNTKTTFKVLKNAVVYDNTSGKLVPFSTILQGEEYPIVSDYGNWYRILVSGRVGYINKDSVSAQFSANDKYFKVSGDNVPVYNNQRGTKLVQVGTLEKGQAYERVSDYGNWHRIQFEDGYGYVQKSQTVPNDGKSIDNLNTSYKNTKTTFEVLKTAVVYDNASGKLVPFATIQQGEKYPVASNYGNWYRILVSGRVGYINKDNVKWIPTKSVSYTSTQYNITLDGMVDKEMGRSPQTDQTIGYLREDAFGKITGSTGIVSGSDWRVRSGPSTSGEIVGTLQNGHQVKILGQTKVGSFIWYEVKYVVPFGDAFENEVDYFVDPSHFTKGTSDYYQFLKLSSSANVDVGEVNQKILAGKGVLAGEAQAFINAAKQFNVNEIYLISHALLETGNGTSKLATGGYVINGKKVYNMYGIDATDSCSECGAQYAYDHGWFTPEQAIIGGAQFIDLNYILAGQNTLYKMRWNPDINNLSHQYATDIGWAVKQTTSISNLYGLLDTYNLVFDVPVYKVAG